VLRDDLFGLESTTKARRSGFESSGFGFQWSLCVGVGFDENDCWSGRGDCGRLMLDEIKFGSDVRRGSLMLLKAKDFRSDVGGGGG
jgi:hypothetical protein